MVLVLICVGSAIYSTKQNAYDQSLKTSSLYIAIATSPNSMVSELTQYTNTRRLIYC